MNLHKHAHNVPEGMHTEIHIFNKTCLGLKVPSGNAVFKDLQEVVVVESAITLQLIYGNLKGLSREKTFRGGLPWLVSASRSWYSLVACHQNTRDYVLISFFCRAITWFQPSSFLKHQISELDAMYLLVRQCSISYFKIAVVFTFSQVNYS